MATSETSSIRFDAPLFLELSPSRRLRGLVCLAGMGALFAAGVLPIPIELRAAGVGVLLVGTLWQWRRATARYPAALRCHPELGWSLRIADQWHGARSLRCTYLARMLVIIEAEIDGMGRFRLPILADQADRQSWRRLRRCLARWAGSS